MKGLKLGTTFKPLNRTFDGCDVIRTHGLFIANVSFDPPLTESFTMVFLVGRMQSPMVPSGSLRFPLD
jgi:hypothetical protein